jgi:hypothetical protein
MKRAYHCPHCGAALNPGTKIILIARRGRRRGLILFSPQIGNYKIIRDPSFELKAGDLVEFSCPVCATSLSCDADRRLAEVELRQPAGRRAHVVFSRVYGEHATFLLDGETLLPFGADADHYDRVNFFGN